MTPAARVAAASEILDAWLAGEPAEKVLTSWARRSRFAGSKDRAAVRDLVFEAIRRRRSAAVLGGASTGRGLMIGLHRATDRDPAQVLTGERYALAPLTETEAGGTLEGPIGQRLDFQDWMEAPLRESLGDELEPVMDCLRSRAELFLRVNTQRTDMAGAQEALRQDGIETVPHPLSATALRVVEGARRVHLASAYSNGDVEIQDVASQAATARIPLPAQSMILDLCAGGGGKALALAARGSGPILAHDANPGRMKDLKPRADRAGADIRPADSTQVDQNAPFMLVVADVPCSGSGAWRRQPEAKWRLTSDALEDLVRVQQQILERAAALTAAGGSLAYMTCSILEVENDAQVDRFLRVNSGWQETDRRRFAPLDGGDGFFLAVLRRNGDDS